MKRHENEYVLSSGRRIYANNGIIGINDELEVREGYDGYIYEAWCDDGLGETSHLSVAEQNEICDYMIDLWKRRKDKPAAQRKVEDE